MFRNQLGANLIYVDAVDRFLDKLAGVSDPEEFTFEIEEIGKSDIIGGIKSNWVKVKIQRGSRTPEGHLIRPGLIGWCYGGYLK